jgi:hypothetical protein
MELQGKPDFEQAMRRIDAWFAHEMVDRPPVRFAEHNADFAAAHTLRHLDRILAIPENQAIQWVHGVGNDAPILQWLPAIKRIQAAGNSVIVDLQLEELEPFIALSGRCGALTIDTFG